MCRLPHLWVGVWFCGLVDGWVFLLTFWYLTAYLKHLSPLQGYFGVFCMGYMEEHISTLYSTMLAITQFQAVDTLRFTPSKNLKCEILHMDEGALPPATPVNPYLGGRARKKWTTFQIPRTFSSNLWNMSLFRWFKFTLKPPYSIAIGKLWLAIWDTSFWTFWVKFGHKGPWDIS